MALHFVKSWPRNCGTVPAGAATATLSRRSATRRSSSSSASRRSRACALWAKMESFNPTGLRQGPRRARADRGRRGEGRDPPRPDDPRADLGQHRHLAGDDLLAQGLQAQGRHARQRDARADAAAEDVRRRDRLLAGRPGLQRRGRAGAEDGRRGLLVLHALPVRQRGQPARALQRHGAGDPRGARRDQRVRRRPRHGRDADGRRPAAARGARATR